MEQNGDGAKVTGIREILRLKELLQKWKTISVTQKPNSTLRISPAVNRRLKDGKWTCTCDSDDEICQSPESPHDVPKGYLAVYVGQELRRFIVPTSYLGHHLFKILLEKAEEEFGFDHRGGLTLPCDVETFKYLLKCMESHQRDHLDDNHESSAESREIVED